MLINPSAANTCDHDTGTTTAVDRPRAIYATPNPVDYGRVVDLTPGGTQKARFEQSTFKAQAQLISPAGLRKTGADYMPTVTEDGEVARVVLEAMAGGQRLQDIAEALARQPPAPWSVDVGAASSRELWLFALMQGRGR